MKSSCKRCGRGARMLGGPNNHRSSTWLCPNDHGLRWHQNDQKFQDWGGCHLDNSRGWGLGDTSRSLCWY